MGVIADIIWWLAMLCAILCLGIFIGTLGYGYIDKGAKGIFWASLISGLIFYAIYCCLA